MQFAPPQAAQAVPDVGNTAHCRVSKAQWRRQKQLACKVENCHIDELFLIFPVDSAGAVGGYLGQGRHVKTKGGQALDNACAALGVDNHNIAGALIHGGGAHAGQIGKVVLQLVCLRKGHTRLVEVQADAPAALMQNIPFHAYTLPKQKLPACAGSPFML